MLDSIEKLRGLRDEAASKMVDNPRWVCARAEEIADEIEREHAQRVAGLTGDLCSYERRNKELKDALKAVCRRFGVSSTEWSAEDAAKKVLETLERDYMPLPVDADGVPIHVGDVLDPPKGSEDYGRLMVVELSYDGEDWYFKGEVTGSFMGLAGTFNVLGFTHAKPRTVEDVLADLANEVWEASCTCQTTWSDSGLDGIEKKYADEIRELLGGDAE